MATETRFKAAQCSRASLTFYELACELLPSSMPRPLPFPFPSRQLIMRPGALSVYLGIWVYLSGPFDGHCVSATADGNLKTLAKLSRISAAVVGAFFFE